MTSTPEPAVRTVPLPPSPASGGDGGRSQGGTVRPWPLVRHSLALAGRSLTRTRRNPGVLLDALILPVIFLVLFVYLFGGAVAGSTREYLQYLFPGILVLTTVLAGQISTGLSIVTDMKKGVFDRFRSMPVPRAALLIGSVLADAIRYVIAVVVLFGVGYLLGFRVETDLGSALAAAALAIGFGFSLSWLTVLLAVLLRDETMVSTVGFLLPFPLVFGTSMAAPVETMPGWLRAWAEVNPVSHAIEASQGLLLGGPAAGAAGMTLLWGGIFLAVFGTAAVTAYRRLV
ncbi:ABC transporter permease [Myceligenerans indicum]|uniref:Transport permease protein n=1 Tax=Myceligenerans indicum TaxID=2593663 RepID=A0ABS1LQX3_9MICO|nr:ABC transporter permease [Myceligenerans indicum]MBL0888697.1 ABC transporter permease [Myceligenerans indicum]